MEKQDRNDKSPGKNKAAKKILGMKHQPYAFMGCEGDFQESRIVLFGAPFDSTTSFRPGTRFGPQAIRMDSVGMETYSPYQDKNLEEAGIFDSGDLELPFGNPGQALDEIRRHVAYILEEGKIPFMIGGEHLVTLGAVEAVAKKYPHLSLIHLDAHTDLREDFMGEKLSHATVMRRIWEILGDHRLFQFGIRSGTKEEFVWAQEHTTLQKFTLSNMDKLRQQLKDQPVYLSVDLDVLDPSVFCGTGTPEPGGVSFLELLMALLQLKGLNIVAGDINELSPHYDPSGASTAVACKILREILFIL